MKSLLRGLLAALSLTALACSAAQEAPKFDEGKHYNPVREVQKPADPKRIEVNEFFWYGCPHCYAFDPFVEDWKKTKAGDVDFVRVPNSLGRPIGIMHSKAFYTAEALNLGDKVHKPLFDAFHQAHQLDTEDQVTAVFNRVTGMMPDLVKSTLNGFAVDSRVRRAEQLSKTYGIASVPTVVVGGKYYTNASLAGGFPEMIKVIDFLVDKVRRERAGK
ncbi:MAG TPA: thiol:disulfide interchange protein DsbA/DsbL [Solimonas sp.]|nr:thiol:disulfide interchange protein DsbA/DsbL [Solimonas sp.]